MTSTSTTLTPRMFLLLLLTVTFAGCDSGSNKNTSNAGAYTPPPPSVSTVVVATKDYQLNPVYAGRAEASERVHVRSQVGGTLLKSGFSDGADVRAGDVLFLIDSAPYEANLEKSKADLAYSEAQLKQAKRELIRTEKLYKDRVVSQQVFEDAQVKAELAVASVSVAKAQMNQAQVDLSHTTVKSTLTGVAGLKSVSDGSVVSPGDTLVTIAQLDPIKVTFSIPESSSIVRQLIEAKVAANQTISANVLNGQRTPILTGAVNFISKQVDSTTGTITVQMKADNSNKRVLDGQFVRVQLTDLLLRDVIVIPEASIVQGAAGPFVYVVSDDDTAVMTPVTLGPVLPEGQWIQKGLKTGDQIITAGVIRVRPGGKVTLANELGGKQ